MEEIETQMSLSPNGLIKKVYKNPINLGVFFL
jgi:hypothetical protein